MTSAWPLSRAKAVTKPNLLVYKGERSDNCDQFIGSGYKMTENVAGLFKMRGGLK